MAALVCGSIPQLFVVVAAAPLAARVDVDLHAGGLFTIGLRLVAQVFAIVAKVWTWAKSEPPPEPRRSARLAALREQKAEQESAGPGPKDELPEATRCAA